MAGLPEGGVQDVVSTLTDDKISSDDIANDTNHFSSFIANRQAIIRPTAQTLQWNHVDAYHNNPLNQASQDTFLLHDEDKSKLWRRGPASGQHHIGTRKSVCGRVDLFGPFEFQRGHNLKTRQKVQKYRETSIAELPDSVVQWNIPTAMQMVNHYHLSMDHAGPRMTWQVICANKSLLFIRYSIVVSTLRGCHKCLQHSREDQVQDGSARRNYVSYRRILSSISSAYSPEDALPSWMTYWKRR